MFATGRQGWYLPVAVFALLFIFAGFGYDRHIFTPTQDREFEGLNTFLSINTIAALKEDERLQSTLLGLTETIAQTSIDVGQKFGLEDVAGFGAALTAHVTELRTRRDGKIWKRGLFSDLGQAAENLLGKATGGSTSGGLSGIIGNLGDSLIQGLATPSLFLGIGVGMGASTGLNITDMASAKTQATKLASAFNASATGINLAAQNLGSGLAGQIAPSLGQQGLFTNMPVGPAAFALASGIGNSTARALNLTNQSFMPSNDSGIVAIAGNLGLGISTPIVSNINFQALMQMAGGSGAGAAIMQQLPQIAAAAGNGIGEGVKDGLGLQQTNKTRNLLTRRQAPADPLQGVDVPGAVGQFTKGLSQSLLTGVDVTKITSNLNITGNLGAMIDPSMLPALAAGAGTGIGTGLAVGLSFKSANTMPITAQDGNLSSSAIQTATAAEMFTQSLVASFLLNSTALEGIGSMLMQNKPQALTDVNPSKAAEGFARGAIEGVANALSSVGGLGNLVSGNFSNDAMANVPVLSPTKFDDSINGSAVGFARGFMGEGTILVGEVLKQMNLSTKIGGLTSRKRDVDTFAREAAVVPYNALTARQAQDNSSAAGNGNPAVNGATIMVGGQLAINTLTCEGIGGVASVALGVLSGNKKKLDLMTALNVPLDPQAIGSLPQEPINFVSDGNTFRVELKDAKVAINGLPLIPFGVLTALHILFMMISFLLVLPLYIIFGVVWRLSVMAGYPVTEVKNKKWRMNLLVIFGITAAIGITLGIIGMGNSRHFRDAHGIFGLITLILVIPTVVSTMIRLRSQAPFPPPATFAGITAPFSLIKSPDQRIYLISALFVQIVFTLGQVTFINGFSTLRSISLCLVDAVLTSNLVAGFTGVVLMVQITAAGVVGIRTWLEQHIAKREKAGVQRFNNVEAGVDTRKASIATFGFGSAESNMPPTLDLDRPQRNTEDLKGFSDEKISGPFNVRKEGGSDAPDSKRPSLENPFLSATERRDPETTGEYEYKYTSAIDDNKDYFNLPVGYQAEISSTSDAIGSSAQTLPPKTQGVTVKDLYPPPVIALTGKSVSSRYSRPPDDRQGPDTEALRGAGNGPGDTVWAKR